MTSEILRAVAFLFAENLFLNEQENHFTDVFATMNAPFFHQRGSHGTKLLEGKIAETHAKFAAADVAGAAAGFVTFQGEVERILEEQIGVGIETLIALKDGNHGMFEGKRLHGGRMRQGQLRCQRG